MSGGFRWYKVDEYQSQYRDAHGGTIGCVVKCVYGGWFWRCRDEIGSDSTNQSAKREVEQRAARDANTTNRIGQSSFFADGYADGIAASSRGPRFMRDASSSTTS